MLKIFLKENSKIYIKKPYNVTQNKVNVTLRDKTNDVITPKKDGNMGIFAIFSLLRLIF
jgi:hypothetical protein